MNKLDELLRKNRQLVSHVQIDDDSCGGTFGIMAPADGLAAIAHWCCSKPGQAGEFHMHVCMCGARSKVAIVRCDHPTGDSQTCGKVVDGLTSTKIGHVAIISSIPCGHLVRRQEEERA